MAIDIRVVDELHAHGESELKRRARALTTPLRDAYGFVARRLAVSVSLAIALMFGVGIVSLGVGIVSPPAGLIVGGLYVQGFAIVLIDADKDGER